MAEAKNQSEARQRRAEQIVLTDIRQISDTVWEIDAINDRGEKREEITIIPEEIYANTKDSRYRGSKGIVEKYTRALAMENDEAYDQLMDAIEERRERIQNEISDLKQEDSNLLHAQADLDGL